MIIKPKDKIIYNQIYFSFSLNNPFNKIEEIINTNPK